MLKKQSISSIILPITPILKQIAMTAILILASVISPSCFARAEITYGPIKSGQTLWEIAEETLPDNSISIEQHIYAIYDSNPDAFRSGNMNLLRTGSIINIPDTKTILKTSEKEAKKQLGKHTHSLDVLRADAKHLKKAITKTREYKLQVKKLQKTLANYPHKSRDWNKTYLQLVTAKKRYSTSTRKVTKLRRLLLEKATLKADKSSKEKPSKTTARKDKMDEVNTRLNQLQAELDTLNKSNNKLVEKVNALARLEDRINVISQELGNNDEVVLALKTRLQNTQEAIDRHIQKSKAIQQRIDNLETTSSKHHQAHKTSIENLKAEVASLATTQAVTTPQNHLPMGPNTSNLIEETSKLETKNNSTSQLQAIDQSTDSDTPTYWKIIVIGGFLNGIILIFILLRLLFNKQSQQLFLNSGTHS